MKRLLLILISLLFITGGLSSAKTSAPRFGAYWIPDIAIEGPDAMIWDGGCIRPMKTEKGRVYFRALIPGFLKEEVFSFPKKQLVKDPRTTKRWHLYLFDEYLSLWEGIEIMAATFEMPDVTRRILNDMVRNGIVKRGDFKKLTSGKISRILVRYTLLTSPLLYPVNGGRNEEGDSFFETAMPPERAVFLLFERTFGRFQLMHRREKMNLLQ